MPAGLVFKPLVNGEEVWKLWNGVDIPQDLSLSQIHEKYRREGNINPKTGEPVTKGGLWMGAWVWAVEHAKEAIPQMIAACESRGEFYTQERAEKLFVHNANKLFSHSRIRFNKFIKENNFEKYL